MGRLYASYGVTALHDATPDLADDTAAELTRAAHDGRLPQHLTLLGAPGPGPQPYKLLPPDHDLWPYDEVLHRIRTARGSAGRPVAVHCVTREALILTLVALREAGPVPGDRIEHAAVVPPELHADMRELGVHVVTQPVFVAERGDTYLAEVDPADLPHLYPYASLLAAGDPGLRLQRRALRQPRPLGRRTGRPRPAHSRRPGARARRAGPGGDRPGRAARAPGRPARRRRGPVPAARALAGGLPGPRRGPGPHDTAPGEGAYGEAPE